MSEFEKRRKGIKKSWVSYKGKTIQLKFEPRTGTCSDCGEYGEHNHLHHEEYHDDDPLKGVIELCPKCHGSRHKKRKGVTL